MKITEFLEKHVQWIALGLAGLWLLYVGWAYGVNRPEVDLGGQKLSAGSVDEYIRDSDSQALGGKLTVQTVPEGLLEVPDFSEAFVSSMNGQPGTPYPLVVNSPPPYALTPITVGPKGGARGKFIVQTIPRVVTPTDVVVQAGRSLVGPPQNPPAILNVVLNNANGNNANDNGGNKTIFTDNNVAQPQPAGAAAAALPGQQVAQIDKAWETVFAKLNFTEQDNEFKKVNIPPFLMQKQYIEVQLQRQEVLPDGTFGEVQMVQALPMNRPPVDRKKPAEFIKWSADPEAQRVILAPPFYTVIKGASWEIPHKDLPQVAQAPDPNDNFNLQQKYQEYKALKTDLEKSKFTDGWTNEQKQAFYKYRTAEAAKEGQKNPQPVRPQPGQRYIPSAPRGGGPGGRGGPGGQGDAIDPQLLREMYADGDAPARRRALPQNFDNPYSRMRNYRRPYEGDMPGMQQQPQQQILANLNPDAAGNVDIWAHDETAQPGRTYRYRLRAIIKNPMFDTNVGAKPEMNKAPYLPADLATGGLDMTSAWSEWSKSVAVPTSVDMMLVSAQSLNGKEVARFRVQRFQEGQMNEAKDGAGKPKPFEVAPGDTIGGMEKVAGVKTPVDFTTSWMLVDIRQTGNDYRVRVMDPQGRMEVRTLSGDRGKFKDDAIKPAIGAAGNAVGLLQRPPQN